jgi:hypothetical protein
MLCCVFQDMLLTPVQQHSNSSIRRYNNNLAHMPPALQLPLLQQLNVAANHLRALSDMSACPSIVRVAAYWNRISVFPLNHPIPTLESLELQRNVLHLGKLLPQSRDVALQFSSLTRLSLSNNALPQLQVHVIPCAHTHCVAVLI